MSMQRKRETYYNSRKLPFSLCRQPGVNSVINIYSNASGKKTNIILPSQISDLFSLDLLENPKFTLQHFNPVFAILFIGTQLFTIQQREALTNLVNARLTISITDRSALLSAPTSHLQIEKIRYYTPLSSQKSTYA